MKVQCGTSAKNGLYNNIYNSFTQIELAHQQPAIDTYNITLLVLIMSI